MKKIILSLACSSAFFNVMAQEEMDKFMLAPSKKLPVTTAKTTAGASRLIAVTTFQYDGVTTEIDDSTVYAYSGGRGGDYTTEQKYDLSVKKIMKSGSYQNNGRTMKTFDASDNVLSSVYQNWDVAGSSWINYSKNEYTYNASNKELNQTSYLWDKTASAWDNNYSYTNVYDAGGKVESRVTKKWNTATSTWDNYSRYPAYVYDASGNLKESVFQMWEASSSSWKNNTRHSYNYDASNNRILYVSQSWANATSTWENLNLFRSDYNGSGLLNFESNAKWNTASSSWDSTSKYTYTYDASKFQIGSESKSWSVASSSWTNAGQFFYTNNSYGQMLTFYAKYWKVGGFYEYGNGSKYYYEEYTPSSITSVAKNSGGQLKLYPVPAQNTISLELKLDAAQAANLSITDHLGRVNMQWTIPSAQQYQEQIDLSILPAGNYFMNVRGAQGAAQTQQFTIVK